MAEIVSITEVRKRAQEETVMWECYCGGSLFFLYSDGTVRCNTCGSLSESLRTFCVEEE